MNVTFRSSTHAGRREPSTIKVGVHAYADLLILNRRMTEWLAWRACKAPIPRWHSTHPDNQK